MLYLQPDPPIALFSPSQLRSLAAPSPGRPTVHHVLNEVVIDRGSSPSAVTLDIFVDDGYVTTGAFVRLFVGLFGGKEATGACAPSVLVWLRHRRCARSPPLRAWGARELRA